MSAVSTSGPRRPCAVSTNTIAPVASNSSGPLSHAKGQSLHGREKDPAVSLRADRSPSAPLSSDSTQQGGHTFRIEFPPTPLSPPLPSPPPPPCCLESFGAWSSSSPLRLIDSSSQVLFFLFIYFNFFKLIYWSTCPALGAV